MTLFGQPPQEGVKTDLKAEKPSKNDELSGVKPLENNQSVEKKVLELQKQLNEMTELSKNR